MLTPVKINGLINHILCAMVLFMLVGALPSPTLSSEAGKGIYPDRAGQEAMRLWSEKEKEREMSEAVRRYWDYWSIRQPRRYSAYRLWFELEQTQRWLNDPDNNPLPPPPPIPPGTFMPYAYPPYPYMYYPPPWAYGPWYPQLYRPAYPYQRGRHRR